MQSGILHESYLYLLARWDRFIDALTIHVSLSVLALLIAIVICIPLGIWSARSRRISTVTINLVSALRVLPSLAILVVMLPYLGLGFTPALAALTILACPPILINTYTGFRDVDPDVVEAAYGMGMTPAQVLWWIESPLALPVVVAGLRTAAVEVVASATLAAFIGGGGLGEFIINGLGLNDMRSLLVGAVPVALLALLVEGLFALTERVLRLAAQ